MKTHILSRKEMKEIFGNIGESIRKFRDERCYTQDLMANRLGITQSAYYKIESGMVKIKTERLIQIAEILGKPIEAFLEKEKYVETFINDQKVYINLSELELLQKTINQQEKRIEELECKVIRKDKKIDELKQLFEK